MVLSPLAKAMVLKSTKDLSSEIAPRVSETETIFTSPETIFMLQNGTAGLKGANGTSGPHAHGANRNTENGVNGTIVTGTNAFSSHGVSAANAATVPKSGMFFN